MDDSQVRTVSTVRYVKNGPGGRWWNAAREGGEAHFGWPNVEPALLKAPDWQRIEAILRPDKSSPAASADFNRLREILTTPQDHIWVTFEDGCLWWCTLLQGPQIECATPGGSHFRLRCGRPWSNESLGGRKLVMRELPGSVTTTAGFRGTVCTPVAAKAILRIITDQKDPVAAEAASARRAYIAACQRTIQRLGPQDFELLVDLVLSRSGWVRSTPVGETQKDIDIDVTNLATGDRAFVQVKSRAGQAEFDRYLGRFQEHEGLYDRMIFAVHTTDGEVRSPSPREFQVWTVEHLAELTVLLGLGKWVEDRLA